MARLITSVAGLVILAGCIAEMRPAIDPLNPMVVNFAPSPTGETLGGFREGDTVKFKAANFFTCEFVVACISRDGHSEDNIGRVYIQALKSDFEVKTLRVHPTVIELVEQKREGEIDDLSDLREMQ